MPSLDEKIIISIILAILALEKQKLHFSHSALISLKILVTLRSFTQFESKIRAIESQKITKPNLTW